MLEAKLFTFRRLARTRFTPLAKMSRPLFLTKWSNCDESPPRMSDHNLYWVSSIQHVIWIGGEIAKN